MRKLLAMGIIIITFAVSIVVFLVLSGSSSKELAKLTSQRAELNAVKSEYASLKTRVQAIESKKNLSKTTGVVSALDEIVLSLGLKGRLKSAKLSGTKDIKDGIEEEADIQIEKLSMNETANLLYRLENAPMILVIKRITMRPSFDEPTLLNLSMTISLVRNK